MCFHKYFLLIILNKYFRNTRYHFPIIFLEENSYKQENSYIFLYDVGTKKINHICPSMWLGLRGHFFLIFWLGIGLVKI